MSERRIKGDFRFLSDLGNARRVQDEIEEALQSCGYGERDIFAIRLALEEAFVNAIKHGNQMDPDKLVTGTYEVSADRFDIRIADEGPGFNPKELPDPTDPQYLDRPCGRGVFLIKNFMTEVKYHGTGNEVSMYKLRNGEAEE